MQSFSRSLAAVGLVCLTLVCVSCGTDISLSQSALTTPLEGIAILFGSNSALGDVTPVHDPSLIRQGNTWYSFSSDSNGTPTDAFLSIRCSSDLISWKDCGSVFTKIPSWLATARSLVPEDFGLPTFPISMLLIRIFWSMWMSMCG